MVSNEVILQTVRRMVASGVDDDTIKMTLKGIDLSEGEIGVVLREAKSTTQGEEEEAKRAAASASGAVGEGGVEGEEGVEGKVGDYEGGEDDGADEEEEEGFGDDAGDELHDHIESTAQEQLAHHSETHQLLEEHADRIAAVHADVSALHEKVDSGQRLPSEVLALLSALDRRISSLEKAVAEAGAHTLALKSIMQKIIDTERQVLLELQKKK